MEIAELLPHSNNRNANDNVPVMNDSMIDTVHKPIQEAILSVSEAYELMDSKFRQEKIREYLASGPISKIEEAIEKQYQLAIAGDPSALERVKEGMIFWKQLVLKKMEPA